MNLKRRIVRAVAAAFIAAAGMTGLASQAQANLITNGDFDVFVPNNATGGGWTTENIVGQGWRSTAGNPDANFILNGAGLSDTDPTLSQTVSGLEIGKIYRITGDFARADALPDIADAFEIRIDGNTIASLDSPSGSGYVDFLVEFVATSTTHTLSLAGEANGSDASFHVDNIALNLIPEPTTLGFLGLAGVAVLRRRK